MKTYMTRQQGERACAKRSLLAYAAGEYSQQTLRRRGTSYVGGTPEELAELGPNCPIVAQWCAGYIVKE